MCARLRPIRIAAAREGAAFVRVLLVAEIPALSIQAVMGAELDFAEADAASAGISAGLRDTSPRCVSTALSTRRRVTGG